MSRFYCEDLVEFQSDSKISGLIYMTWSDIELNSPWTDEELYVHSALPINVLRTWRKEQRLVPGYVILEFMLPGDGFCLVREDVLRLRDRPLFLGDIVKRNASDQQSGRIISTSVNCALEPVCSVEEYTRARPIAARAHQLTLAASPSRGPLTMLELHNSSATEQKNALNSFEGSNLIVSAGDLHHFQDFWEGDYVIYENKIGLVTAVYHEVTVRLSNGSVVVVEEPDELEIPLYVPGSSSHMLAQHLRLAGYHVSDQKRHTSYALNDSRGTHAAWFFPGQDVQTKKGNLRRGRWKFGAYDPNIEPRGLVVDVRTVELNLDILFPDHVESDRAHDSSPSITLSTDDLEHGKVEIIDRSRKPSHPLAKALADAATENGYGRPVRLKGAVASSLKQAERFSGIPRTDTQGYDMNIFHVSSTKSKALVCWQDGSFSAEETISLKPLSELDQNDVWPGDKVSLKTDEMIMNLEPGSGGFKLHARTVGVVQTVNAAERLAKVRWFEDSDIKIDLNRDNIKRVALPSLDYGAMTDRISEVSLYELSPYDALEPNLGDLALSLSTCASSKPQASDPWGEVVELCLDGDVILRCYNSSEPYDLKVKASNMIIISHVNMEEDWDDSDSSRAEEEGNNEKTPEPIDIQFEYEGGNRLDIDGNEDAWSTDDVSDSSASSNSKFVSNDTVTEPQLRKKDLERTNAAHVNNDEQPAGADLDEFLTARSLSPSSFQILDGDPPSDHHYFGNQKIKSNAHLARAIAKQYKSLESSLPEGIYVRTWDSRLDLLRALIVGPGGTPYEHTPFLFDMCIPPSFPDDPPLVFFHSWNSYLGRINPNLYEDGKVCLSLLGTWPADEKSQGWSKRSTILQVLVSIIGLILVREPYYNETGYEVLIGSEASDVASRIYSEKAFIMAKGFVARALSDPPNAFKDVVDWLYCAPFGPQLLHRIICEYRISSTGLTRAVLGKTLGNSALLDREQEGTSEKSWAEATGRLSAGARVPLEKHLKYLLEYEDYINSETAARPSIAQFDNQRDGSDRKK